MREVSNVRRKAVSLWLRQYEAFCPLCKEYRGLKYSSFKDSRRKGYPVTAKGVVIRRCVACAVPPPRWRVKFATVTAPSQRGTRGPWTFYRPYSVERLRGKRSGGDSLHGGFASKLVARALVDALNARN